MSKPIHVGLTLTAKSSMPAQTASDAVIESVLATASAAGSGS
jgi:hypothetical protein